MDSPILEQHDLTADDSIPAARAVRYRANVLDLQRAVLEVRQLDDGQCRFTLRSRVNIPILSGCTPPAHGDLPGQADRIAQLCADEHSLRIVPQDGGFRVDLMDLDGTVMGQSGALPSESLARATQKLIAIQARQANIDLL